MAAFEAKRLRGLDCSYHTINNAVTGQDKREEQRKGEGGGVLLLLRREQDHTALPSSSSCNLIQYHSTSFYHSYRQIKETRFKKINLMFVNSISTSNPQRLTISFTMSVVTALTKIHTVLEVCCIGVVDLLTF